MTFDPDLVRSWLRILHGDSPGLIHICATDLWTGRAFAASDIDQAAEYVAHLDAQRREGIYVRVTTLRGELAPDARGSEQDGLALSGLWADIDLAGPGHKTTKPLPPDEAAAKAIIAAAGLPDPSLWIHSGGGLYPWWRLERPHVITDDLADIKDLAANWQRAVEYGAAQLGWDYGRGVGDLARVLRIPGTVNRKASLERPCRIVSATQTTYRIEELHEAVAAALSAIPEPEPAPRLASVRTDDGSLSPGDDYAARVDWADILQPAGWRYAYSRGQTRYWRRPGKDTAGISATTNALGTDRLRVFSTSAAPFECESYSKLGAYALLKHGGDHHAAAKALKGQGYGRPAPLAPDPAATQREAIAELLPAREPVTLAAVDGTAVRVIAEPIPAPEAFGPTEDGLARALVAHHRHDLRFCPQRGRWLRWDGHRWAWDDGEHHRELIRALARQLPDIEGWTAFKKRALSAIGVSGVARLAQSDPGFFAHVRQLDARPWEVNTPSGIVDLRTGTLRPPDPAAMHTRTASVAPDFDRPAEVFTRFLTDTFGGDPDLTDYIQRLLGLSAIGSVLEQVLLFAHGSGANGKSTLLEIAMHVLGFGDEGYAMAAPAEMLMQRRNQEHPTELAQLAGARLVVCSELDDGQRFAEARVKQLTGRDSINARFMRRDPFTFVPSHTLWLLGNHKPAAKVGGPAFWRRVRLLPFTHVVPEADRDPRLAEKLVEEGPAVLAWIARGAADYHQGGLREPGAVSKATEAYARDQDTLGSWVEDACHLAPAGAAVRVSTADARRSYEQWCAEMGEEPVSAKRFGMDLRDRFGVAVIKSNGRKFYSGLTVLEAGSDGGEDVNDLLSGSDGGRYR